jgi:hypothetical protein
MSSYTKTIQNKEQKNILFYPKIRGRAASPACDKKP